MKFIWVIGVEGSGHHMVFDVLFHKFKDRDTFLYESDGGGELKDLHNHFSAYFEADTETEVKKQSKIEIHRLLGSYSKHASEDELILFDRVSSPYSNPRDTLRRWDIIAFIELVKNYAELKLIVMIRNPISTTFSCLRRGFTDNPYLQAKIIEDNYIFINSQMQTVQDQNIYRILDYDAFFADPDSYAQKLAAWLGCSPDDFRNESLLNAPRRAADIPEPIGTILSEFFTAQRQAQWAWLYEHPNNFSNYQQTL